MRRRGDRQLLQVFSDIGPENIVRIFHTGPANNVINVGQTRSEFLFGSYEGAFGFPTRCGAPHIGKHAVQRLERT